MEVQKFRPNQTTGKYEVVLPTYSAVFLGFPLTGFADSYIPSWSIDDGTWDRTLGQSAQGNRIVIQNGSGIQQVRFNWVFGNCALNQLWTGWQPFEKDLQIKWAGHTRVINGVKTATATRYKITNSLGQIRYLDMVSNGTVTMYNSTGGNTGQWSSVNQSTNLSILE